MMARRNRNTTRVLWPGCDRCARPMHPRWLRFDGLGHVCPACARGQQR